MRDGKLTETFRQSVGHIVPCEGLHQLLELGLEVARVLSGSPARAFRIDDVPDEDTVILLDHQRAAGARRVSRVVGVRREGGRLGVDGAPQPDHRPSQRHSHRDGARELHEYGSMTPVARPFCQDDSRDDSADDGQCGDGEQRTGLSAVEAQREARQASPGDEAHRDPGSHGPRPPRLRDAHERERTQKTECDDEADAQPEGYPIRHDPTGEQGDARRREHGPRERIRAHQPACRFTEQLRQPRNHE